MSRPSLLVLSASTGNGHVSAANAIVDEAKRRGIRAEHIDVLDHVTPAFRKWYRGGYETLVRRSPKAWGHLYETSDRPRFNYHFQTNLDKQFCKHLEEVVTAWDPDWVVCTHSLPQPAIARFEGRRRFKVAIVVTDLYVHRMWLRGDPDLFFVPQEWSKKVLRERLPGFRGDIVVTGIPVHEVFGSKNGGVSGGVWGDFGSGSRAKALMVSGGIGGGPVVDAARALSGAAVNLAVIAGRNEKVFSDLQKAVGADQHVKVLGAVPHLEMADWMAGADFLISKPGGITTFEALATGLPFVVYWPFLIPGQEEGNAEFLEETGAGVIVRSAADLRLVVDRLAESKDELARMSRAALAQAKPEATRDIVDKLADIG